MANKTIKFGSVFGNYRWDAEAEVSETLADALLPLGALQVAQRSPSTAAEKAIAGYEKRPKGFQRTSIPYTEADAQTLRKHLENMKFSVGDGDDAVEFNLDCVVNVAEYEGGGSAESKYTAERKKYVQRCAEGTGSTLAKKVGYDGPIGDGTFEGAPQEFLTAIREFVKSVV